MIKHEVDVRSLPQTINIANSSMIWFKMTGKSLKSVSQNSFKYIQTLKHLQRRVCRVRCSVAPIILQHDNACPHTSRATKEVLRNLNFELIHTLLTPRISCLAIFIFFPLLKRDLEGNHYTTHVLDWREVWWILQWRDEKTCYTLREIC